MNQRDQVLTYLKTGEYITAAGARELFAVERLAPRISELKKRGHNITTVMIRFTTVLGKRGKYAAYKLIE
jgi:Helix-turn-helix domain